jgi:thioredoxin reductase (NADPH)
VAHGEVVQVNEDFGDECRVYVIGQRSSLYVSRYRDFLRRNRVVSRWVDIDRDPLAALLGVRQLGARRLPLFLFADGTVLEAPGPDRPTLYAEMRSELAERVGLHARPTKEEYDLLIVGAGPAGLTAAVYAASRGRSASRSSTAPGSGPERRSTRQACTTAGSMRRGSRS